jgi:dTDP-4-amino-4,6-dideoxygalactose transaminase
VIQKIILSLLLALKNRSSLLLRMILLVTPAWLVRLILSLVGTYPRIVGNEFYEVKKVLLGPHWNTSSGGSSKHKELEHAFADFIGSKFAISVASGGVGILMAFRSLGIKPGSVIAHQVDTCNAVPQALLNAHYSPYFIDPSIENYMIDVEKFKNSYSNSISGILATHLWGYPESIKELSSISKSKNVPMIEDCCLALGLSVENRHVGNFGIAGIFSFGATKPLQVGEGGMITTNDRALADELKTMRNWGERSNSRDLNQLGINGRFSEISSVVAMEQLNGYRNRMIVISDLMSDFQKFISKYEYFDSERMALDLAITNSPIRLIVRFRNEYTKRANVVEEYVRKLRSSGIGAFTINFEPLNTQTFFATGGWKQWTHNLSNEVVANNSKTFEGARFIHNQLGFTLPQSDFASRAVYRDMVKRFQRTLKELSL